jgi:tRNA/rRNA methyltransferase
MGFSRLRIIDPPDLSSDEAKMFAHGSRDVLENAELFSRAEEALEGIDLLISTTAKQKSAKVDYLAATELAGFVKDKLPVSSSMAVIFGSEESGLPNSILQRSNIGVHIPMVTTYPSLNLSQAVMIIAYELSGLHGRHTSDIEEAQSPETWGQLQKRSTEILIAAGIREGTPLFHRIIERMSFLKASDARLVHSITDKIKKLVRAQ